jgi:glycosyltransferase involved in cell wall biosynthesis
MRGLTVAWRAMGLTIGVDARAAAEVPAGRGRYVRELLAALERLPEAEPHRFRLYARRPWGELGPRFEWRLSPLPDPLWHVATAARASLECDAFLSTNSYLTAWFTTVPTMVVVHDLVAFGEQQAHAQARAARIERATIGLALRRAGAAVCVSEATRKDLVARFPRALPKARVVPLAADGRGGATVADDAPARLGLDRPYVLAVGTIEPRKNLERLVGAWSLLPGAIRSSHQLALVGPRGWDESSILAAAERAGARMLGRVSDEDLVALYARAACFAYPSLQEGFGLPVLEAMAAGAPVVTSNVSSLPEVAGDAALLVDPRDVRAIAAGIERVLTDPELGRRLRESGRERAGEFSWERTARETLRVMTGLAGR